MFPLLAAAVFAVPVFSPPIFLEAALPHYTDELIARTEYIYERPATSTEDLIKEVFGPLAPQALKIAKCESRLVPTTTAKTPLEDSRGIFQVNLKAHRADPEKLYEPEYNIRYAKTIYDKAGSWLPWYTCAKNLGLLR